MELAGVRSALPSGIETLLKINISWQHYYPACSSSPWQLDGVIRALKSAGYDQLTPVHNGTVVVDPREGALNNKHEVVTESHGLESVFLEDVEWVDFVPESPMLALDKVYPNGFQIPRMLMDKNVVHLPTVKTHVFTTMTGAMKNAFGGLLNYQRHWTHSVIHETLVDLLRIQKEFHPGIFAVTDGTFAGDGPGPRAMRWHTKNVILASADQVAIDAVSAKLMGFDPMSIPFIRLADEHGLGHGRIDEIDIVGDEYPKLQLTELGEQVMRRRTTVRLPLPPPSFPSGVPAMPRQGAAPPGAVPSLQPGVLAPDGDPDGDPVLLQRLQALRKTLAEGEALPAYTIAHNRTLRELAQHRPTDRAGLLQIHGLGPEKVRKYGDALLGAIRAHLAAGRADGEP